MAPTDRWWLVIRDDMVDVCDSETAARRFASDCGEGAVVEVLPVDQIEEAENDVVDLVNELADAASRFRRHGDIFGAKQAEATLKRFGFITTMNNKSRSSNQRGA